MKTKILTVERANEIHKMWMDLETGAPESKKQKVFAAMKELPKAYLSITEDGKNAAAIVGGSPMNRPMPIKDCIKYYGHHCDLRLAWKCDLWVDLAQELAK